MDHLRRRADTAALPEKKLAVIHFSPVEQYPPVMNFLDFSGNTCRIVVYTTNPPLSFRPYTNPACLVRRFGSFAYANKIIRGLNYIYFYAATFFSLVKLKPAGILYYETNSFLPAWLYSRVSGLFGRKVSIYCHYHEYSSPDEYQRGMFLSKWLNKLERKTYDDMKSVSHTNKKRAALFKSDSGYRGEVTIFPNYPPQQWAETSRVRVIRDFPVKLVYVGAIDQRTMYVAEMASWVKEQQGKVQWDIYSQQDTTETRRLLDAIACPDIRLKGKAEYHDLPSVLSKYDVGLILYKGHTLNYVYNETNKLFEYLACGLSVWYSDKVKGIDEHRDLSSFPKVIAVDFGNIADDLMNVTMAPAPVRKLSRNAEAASREYLNIIAL